ncbi:7291_t:CDS:2, partial [Cetraspora pellucida]
LDIDSYEEMIEICQEFMLNKQQILNKYDHEEQEPNITTKDNRKTYRNCGHKGHNHATCKENINVD